MAQILLSALRTAGSYGFQVAVPVGSTGARLLVDRSLLLSRTARLDWTIELSVDAGINWWSLGGSGIDFASVPDPKYIEAALGRASSGMQRGFLICESKEGGVRIAARSARADETIWRGYETTNTDRLLRGTVTQSEALALAASLDWLTD